MTGPTAPRSAAERRRADVRRLARPLRHLARALGRTPRTSPAGEHLGALNRDQGYLAAAAFAAAHLPDHEADPAFLEQARIAFAKTGELTQAGRTVTLLRQVADSPKRRLQQARIEGRLVETDPSWSPEISTSRAMPAHVSDNRVLHLLKASAPYRESGYTLRSRYVLGAQSGQGLSPVAMTALGFAESVGQPATLPDSEVVDGIEVVHLGPSPDDGGRSDAYLQAYADAAAARLPGLAPSVIHVHSGHRGYDAALVGLALGRHFGLPVVYEVRGFFESTWTSDPGLADQGEHYRRRVATEERCMHAADAVVTLSDSMRADMLARGIAAEKVFVVPNGVDVEAFAPRSRSAELITRYGLRDRFVFGYVSNLDHPREGQEALIDAAVALRDRGVPATALIVGDGRRRAELEELATSRGADDVVVFTGRIDHAEIAAHYALLDVFVVPRIRERAARLVTPLKPYEAMAAGVPLLVSDLPALAEIVGDGERGRTFTAEDPAALTEQLVALQASPNARRELADAARSWILKRRTWPAVTQTYAEVYSMARRRSASRAMR